VLGVAVAHREAPSGFGWKSGRCWRGFTAVAERGIMIRVRAIAVPLTSRDGTRIRSRPLQPLVAAGGFALSLTLPLHRDRCHDLISWHERGWQQLSSDAVMAHPLGRASPTPPWRLPFWVFGFWTEVSSMSAPPFVPRGGRTSPCDRQIASASHLGAIGGLTLLSRWSSEGACSEPASSYIFRTRTLRSSENMKLAEGVPSISPLGSTSTLY
jgi:hypothetical protein